MRLGGRRESQNVEDRRGSPVGRVGRGKIGIGANILMLGVNLPQIPKILIHLEIQRGMQWRGANDTARRDGERLLLGKITHTKVKEAVNAAVL